MIYREKIRGTYDKYIGQNQNQGPWTICNLFQQYAY